MTAETSFDEFGFGADIRCLHMISEQTDVTQSRISKQLGVSSAMVNKLFKKLQQEGFIQPGDSVSLQTTGRPTGLWYLCKDTNLFFVSILLPPLLQIAITDFDGNILSSQELNLEENEENWQEWFRQESLALIKDYSARGSHIRLGVIYLPGGYDDKDGTMISVKAMPELEGVNMVSLLRGFIDFPLTWGCFAVAEFAGALNCVSNDKMLSVISLEMGLGMLLGSKRGILTWQVPPHHDSSNPGHVLYRKNGKLCRCGKRGCIEAYCSGWVLLQNSGCKTLKSFEDKVLADDKKCLDVLRVSLGHLCKFLLPQIRFWQIEALLFTGSFRRIAPVISRIMSEALEDAGCQVSVQWLDSRHDILMGCGLFARDYYLGKYSKWFVEL